MQEFMNDPTPLLERSWTNDVHSSSRNPCCRASLQCTIKKDYWEHIVRHNMFSTLSMEWTAYRTVWLNVLPAR